MAPRRTSASAPTAEPEPNSLPTFNGSQLDLNKWLRDLSNSQHLFEADLAYFLVTGCSVTSSGKTAVVSAEHSALLNNVPLRARRHSADSCGQLQTLWGVCMERVWGRPLGYVTLWDPKEHFSE